MPNGCAFCVVAHIACKTDMTENAGDGQKATRKNGISLLGFLVRGFSQHELQKMKGAHQLTLVELWDPCMEQNPWSSA